MNKTAKLGEPKVPFDPFLVPEDWARLEYGRLLWRRSDTRRRLLRHWCDDRHPYSQRFKRRFRELVERVLSSDPSEDEAMDRELRSEGQSLRTIMREIPPVFGSFF